MADQENGKSDAGSSFENWADADYVAGLKHLQDLQSRIDELRSSLPNIVAPLTASPTPNLLSTVPPSSVYADFAMNVINTSKEIKSLRNAWEDENTKKVFGYAKGSLDKEPELEWEFVKKGRWGGVDEDFVAIKHENSNGQTNGQKTASQAES